MVVLRRMGIVSPNSHFFPRLLRPSRLAPPRHMPFAVAVMNKDPISQRILSEGNANKIIRISSVGGGCINRANRYNPDAGPFSFKTNRSIGQSMFEGEALSLGAMYDTKTKRIPRPFKVPTIEKCPPGFTVLVVEPDATCLTIISKMLSVSGHQVVTAKRGLDALHIIWRKEVEIDLVLTEENLPDISKYDILDAMKELFYLPVVVMSGFRDNMVGSKDAGARFHIVKPVPWSNIIDLWQYSVLRKRGIGLSPVLTGSSQEKSSGKKFRCLEQFLPSSRQKTVWTDDLHDRFLRVVQIIGILDSDPTPEEILCCMNAPCLTREHVSVHLRKYRLILRLEKDHILDTMTADDYTAHLPDQQTGGQHRRSLKRKRMLPGSMQWRLWHDNYGTASSSGSSATPRLHLVEQSPRQVQQEPELDKQASQQLPLAPPPPEEQEVDDGSDSFEDDLDDFI